MNPLTALRTGFSARLHIFRELTWHTMSHNPQEVGQGEEDRQR